MKTKAGLGANLVLIITPPAGRQDTIFNLILFNSGLNVQLMHCRAFVISVYSILADMTIKAVSHD